MNALLSMTVSEWLARTEATFQNAGIESARLDALVLLSDQLGKDKSWLLAYSDHELQGSELKLLSTKVTQRAKHVPLAYVRGHVEFYGNTFTVNEHVLVPRPESESFFVLLQTINSDSFKANIDIGTGSGALAITAAQMSRNHHVYATDISAEALAVARLNANNLHAAVTFFEGSLLDPISDDMLDASVLLCNLPYVPTDYPINPAASFEPSIALFSGHDGLKHYAALFTQLSRRTLTPAYVLTESLLTQHEALQKLAVANGYTLTNTDGLVQLFTHK